MKRVEKPLAFMLILVLMTTLFPPVSLAEGETGSISGLVTDGFSPVTGGATITLKNSSNNAIASITADNSTGSYMFPNVPAGVGYTVTASMTGYLAGSQTGLEVIAGKPTVAPDIMLYPTAPFVFDIETGTITGYDDAGGEHAIIPGVIGGVAVTGIGTGAFAKCTTLKSVVIPYGVTSIGYQAFSECSNLTSVSIPSSVTSIGDSAFYLCTSLNDITLPPALTKISKGLFVNCFSLASINIPSGVTTIENSVFSNCYNLKSISIPDSVTKIDWCAFYNTGLTEISIPGSVTSIGFNAFRYNNLTAACFTGDAPSTFDSDVFANNKPGFCLYYTAGKAGWSADWHGYTAVPRYRITTPDLAGGSISSDTALATAGSAVHLTVTPDAGYRLKAGSLKYSDGALDYPVANNSFTLPSAHVTVSADFEAIPEYALTIQAGAGGSITTGASGNYKPGTVVNITVSMSDGYRFTGWTSSNGGSFGNGSSPSTTFTMPEGPTTVMAETIPLCLLTIQAGSGGTVLTETSGYYAQGETVAVTASANSGHRFSGWSSSSGGSFADATKPSTSFTMPAGPTTLTATFTALGPGSVTGSVTDGTGPVEGATVSLVAGDGFTYSAVTLADGSYTIASVPEGTDYTIKAVAAGHNSGSLPGVDVQAGSVTSGMDLLIVRYTPTEYFSFNSSTGLITGYNIAGGADVVIPESIGGVAVKGIGDHAFASSTVQRVTIPVGVESIGNYAFDHCGSLISIVVPQSVRSIGSYAFWLCTSLAGINLPHGLESIGDHAFSNCQAMTSVSLPDTLISLGASAFEVCVKLTGVVLPSSLSSVSNYAFYQCKGMTSLTIPIGVTSIGQNAFTTCWNLTSVTIPGSVTTIGNNAFTSCTRLTTAYFGGNAPVLGTDVFSNTAMNSTFTVYYLSGTSGWSGTWYGYTAVPRYTVTIGPLTGGSILASVDEALPGQTVNLTITPEVGRWFKVNSLTCTYQGTPHPVSGTSFVMPAANVTVSAAFTATPLGTVSGKVTDGTKPIAGAAVSIDAGGSTYSAITQSDGSYTLLDVPGGAGYRLTVTRAGYVTAALEDIAVLPEENTLNPDVVLVKYTVTPASFFSFDPATGTITGYNMAGGSDVIVPASINGVSVLSIGANAFADQSGLTSVTVADGVTSIGFAAFYYCTGLNRLVLPDSVTSIGDSAFVGCAGLTEFNFPSGLVNIGERAFVNCAGLTSITLPDGLKSLGYLAFGNCSQLTFVILPDGLSTLGDYAFYSCGSLSSISIPGSVASIGNYCFKECLRLRSVTLGQGVTSIGAEAFSFCGITDFNIPSSVTRIGDSAFQDCMSLTSVSLSANITHIGSKAFYDCFSLTGIILPDSVTYLGDGAFGHCHALSSVTLSNGISAIYPYTFLYCSSLTSITIPESIGSIWSYSFANCGSLNSLSLSSGITDIGNYAFANCSSLTGVTFPGSVVSIGAGAFSSCGALGAAYFRGNAPVLGTGVFANTKVGFTVYRIFGKSDWSNPWNGYPAITQYTVTTGTIPGGSITAIPSIGLAGDTVTLTVSPNTGKRLKPGTMVYSYGGNDYPITDSAFILPAANVTVCGDFESIYTVTYDFQDGRPALVLPADYDELLTAPAVPVRAGYTFGGWYKDAACQTPWDFAMDKVSGNVTLYAKWGSTTPTGVLAASASYSSVKVSWTAVPGATGYQVYRATSSTGAYALAGTVTSSSFTNTGLTAGTTYYYKVRSYAGTTKVYSAFSSVVSARPVPAAPTSPKATPATYNSIKVTWAAVSGATNYELYRATSSTGTYALLTTTSYTYYTNTSVNTGAAYYYKVRAYRLVGSTKVYGAFSAVASARTALGTPSSVKAAPVTYSSIKVTWSAVTGASGYVVYRATSSTGTYASVGTATSTSFTNTSIATGITYYYKVRAYRLVGSTKVYSSYSAAAYTTTGIGYPTTIRAARASSSSIKVTWSAVSGATRYELWRSTSSGGTYTLVAVTASLYYTNGNLTTGRTYYYKVRAYHLEGTTKVYGPWSKVVYAKP